MTKVDKDSNVPCKDLIDRRAAIDGICKRCEELYHEYKCDGECDDIRLQKALPSAQPEIIRCRDCKHHWTHSCMDAMPREICDLDQTFYDARVDFCSLAERRTE